MTISRSHVIAGLKRKGLIVEERRKHTFLVHYYSEGKKQESKRLLVVGQTTKLSAMT